MLNDIILDRVRGCMQTALGLSDAEAAAIGGEATPLDVRGWNSLGHIQLILELEKVFGLTVAADDIAELASVPAILQLLERSGI
jgi:acyl carrier protein